jgi:glycosyltransferase involved in cell wall biosynthesis
MPAYNCGTFIAEAMASVLRQTELDLELIVVNDGSTDETLDIVNSMAKKDARIKVLSQANSGKPSIARNRGLEQAKGEFVCFLDGDDLYHPDKIHNSLEVLQRHPAIDMVFHDVKFMNEEGTEQTVTYLQAANFAERVLSKSKRLGEAKFFCDERALFFFMCTTVTSILMSSVLIRRKRLTAEDMFFPEDLTIGEDIDLWFRLVKSGGVAYIDRPLSYYRIYPLSVTKRSDRNIYDPVSAHIKNYKRNAGFLDAYQRIEYRKRIATGLFNIGYTCSCQGKYDEARQSYLRSLRWRFAVAPLKGIIKILLLRKEVKV